MSEEKNRTPAGVIVLTDIVEEGLPLDQLPDLPGGFGVEAGQDCFEEIPENEKSDIPEIDLEVLDLDLEASLMQDAAAEAGEEAVADGKPQSQKEADGDDEIAGDSDALLDDEDFAEIELPEDPDPVLAGLRSAGLRRAGEDGEAGPAAPAASCGPECESPDDYLVDDEPAAEPLRGKSPDHPVGAPGAEAEISSSLAATIRRQVEAAGPGPASSEPEICAEPAAPDFSRQIESLTQEWSKQLLQSTYASMDKMIQAVGDMAPTIVDRVAREIIPPLAEQVIKAEIARLEKKLEGEDDEVDDMLPPSGPEKRSDE